MITPVVATAARSGVGAHEHHVPGSLAVADGALEAALRDYVAHVESARLLPLFERSQTGATERAYLRLPTSVVPCEAWLIRWPSGALAALHDHGSAYGVAQVVAGTLYESRFEADGTRGAERRWSPEHCVTLPHGTYHEVRNYDARVAYSIHVYAPRLEVMTFYDRDPSGKLRPMRQEAAIEWRGAPHP